ncbi:hypothetical protein [Amycolatopsis sp. BJA-103]|uniref:hypothetical protein n=1 Tax=Amycolatopsis sp. BJA-103 TaxID=1911175 RepID=UPI000C778EBD|nr:hypothetical protein [Amycolatopsis sp. BJA-103]AUI61248.1 hypothetical protein BKN51_25765 [Amycolatopsis sp. BJA-103]PNE21463.1 hypothetical protein B1H26_06695 [Amycolatopsis sp. BJA-103]
MTMPPIGGYHPTGPGPGPMTPEQSEALVKQAVAAFKVAFPDPAVLHKGEITAIKNEVNALNLAVNGIKGEFNIVSAQSDLVRLETKPLFDLQEYVASKKGERPDQIKAEAAAAQKKADDAHQLAQNSLRRANQIDSALQRVVINQVRPLDQRVGTVTRDTAAATRLARSADQSAGNALRRANQVGAGVQQGIAARLNPISQSISTLRGQVAQLGRRTAALGQDVTAALRGVRRVGSDQNQLIRRITKLENQKSGQGKGPAGVDTKKLREEADRTRKAASALESAVRGTSAPMRKFAAESKQVTQSLR